jgi:hypothetical protein
MPTYRYHLADERTAPFPPLDNLPQIEAATLEAAVAKLARLGRLPTAGDAFWLRVVLTTHDNGRPRQVLSIQLTPEFQIPIDWQPPDDLDDAK